MKRAATALVLIPVITYVIIWAPPAVFLLVLAAIAILCCLEYNGIVEAQGIPKPGLFGIAAGLLILLAPKGGIPVIAGLALATLATALRSPDFRGGIARSGAVVLGAAYIFASWRCAADLRWINPYWLFLAISLNWAGDSAALFAGRAFGRHKLAPRISPGKTWEGAAASVLGSVAVALVYARFALPHEALWVVAVIVMLANVAGQIGDLCESALKRGAGLKDSGAMLPGHGGWLDRVDSTLFAVPVAYGLVELARALQLSPV